MIKAIFFDIDGTLLSHNTYSVPESTKEALRLLKEKGILTFIATGRHLSEMRDGHRNTVPDQVHRGQFG